MIEEFNKKIEINKDILSTLPKNNHKNLTKYQDTLNSLIGEYIGYKEKIKEEIQRRQNKFLDIRENAQIALLKDKITNLTKDFYLFSTSNSSYEKIGLDKIIYNISRYYNSNLEEVNQNIYQALTLFNQAGIKLTVKDFNYSYYLESYMEVFFQEINNLNSEVVKTTFEKTYWKCSDLLVHLELNLKYLYFKYKKNFDNYCELLKRNFLNDKKDIEIWEEYLSLQRQYDTLEAEDIAGILSKFKEKELNISDFSPVKIEASYKEMVTDLDDLASVNANVKKFYDSIGEYQNYLDIKYILDSVQKLYADKANYKNESKKDTKEINKLQSKLFKINKKINWYKKLNKDYDKLIVELNATISKLKELYDNLDISLFKERLATKINDNSTYYEVLELVYSNYLYLVRCLKDNFPDIEREEIDSKIIKLKDILLSPYNTFINNVTIINDKDIKMIISDCYKLANFKVSPSMFENEGDISNLKDTLYKILVSNWLSKSNLSLDDIKFYCLVSEMEL